MADEDAPLSSYSDPLYDRLDAITRQVRRQWWLFAIGLLCVALAAIAVRLWMHREPIALGGAIAVRAINERDEAKREAAWTELADGAAHDPAFRAAASIELCQLQLSRGDVIKARERAEQAEAQARAAGDPDLVLAAGLSRAATTLDGGDAAAALTLYEQAARGAGAKYPVRKIAAELGAATCLEKLGKADEAMSRLEPITSRTDRGAEQLIQLATSTYWRLKRAQAESAKPVEAKPESVPAAPAAPEAAAPAAAPEAVAPAPAPAPAAQ
jgi:ATP/maltotriose-dependent transcriptional regulator MalT